MAQYAITPGYNNPDLFYVWFENCPFVSQIFDLIDNSNGWECTEKLEFKNDPRYINDQVTKATSMIVVWNKEHIKFVNHTIYDGGYITEHEQKRNNLLELLSICWQKLESDYLLRGMGIDEKYITGNER